MNGKLDEYFQKIEDFVLVEDKIVTYKWIAKALKVHVNTAKQLLHAFSIKEEFKKKLLITYLIADKVNDTSQRFCLVLKDELDKIKGTLNDIISLHVYSIQRNTSFNAKELYNADCTYVLNEDDRKLCSIHKNDDIVKKICGKPVSAIDSSKTRQNATEKPIKKNSENNIAEVKPDRIPLAKEGTPTKCVQSTSPPKKEISKGSPSKNRTAKSKKSPKKLKNTITKGVSIGALFSKQATNALNKKPVKVSVEENDEKEETKENLREIINGTNDENKNSSELDDSIIISTPARQHGKQINRTKKRKKKSKNYESANKRRKRIVVASDSESCDSDMDMEEEYTEPMEEEPQSVIQESDGDEIIPPTPFEQGKRKRIRKDVDKTYTDEEGFFVTNKEYIYESCSDDEAPSANLKLNDGNGKLSNINDDNKTNDEKLNDKNNLKGERKVNSPEKNKESKTNKKSQKKKSALSPKKSQQAQRKQQATLMNFFKKNVN